MAAQAPRTEAFAPPATTGKRIRYLRSFKADMTQDQLSRAVSRLGIPFSRFVLNRIEADRRKATFGEMVGIAIVLDVNVVDLGATEEDYPELKLLRDPAVVERATRV